VYAAQFAAGDDMPMMSARGIEPRPNRVNPPAGWGRGEGGMGVVKCGVSCDWKFQRPSWQKLAFVTWFLRPKITMFPFKKKNVKQLRHFRMRDVIATSHVYNVSV
jgi:hypothetical protein